jgi:tetratricopeptide (TPR) repeat protein
LKYLVRVFVACVLLLIVALPIRGQERPGDPHLNRGYNHLRAGQLDSAVAAFARAVAAEPDRSEAREELVYALLRLERRADALPHLDTLAQQRPSDVRLRRQRGYVQTALGMYRPALEEFVAVTTLAPDDGAAWLQRGYLHARLDDRSAAREAYEEARQLGPPDVAARAQAELSALDAGTLDAGTIFTDIYAAPMYMERFDNLLATGIARIGVIAVGRPQLELYGSVRFTTDTRSTAGAVPEIYADNSIIPAVGARMRAGPVTLFAEAGAAIPVVDGFADGPVLGDVRAGAFHSSAWGPDGLAGGRVGELYADAVYYSRFDDNIIATAIYRDGLRLPAGRLLAVDIYGRGGLSADTERHFFNNVAELGAGLRLVPRMAAAWLGVEYTRGFYLDNTPAGGDRTFGDFRILLVWSRLDVLRGGR